MRCRQVRKPPVAGSSIEIDQPRAPGNIAGFNSYPRLPANIFKVALRITLIKNTSIIREYVKMSIKIVVADTDPHSRLFVAVFAEGDSS